MSFVFDINLEDKTAQFVDELEKRSKQALRRVGKNRAKKMQSDARKKTGAMAAGVTSLVSRDNDPTLQVGGTERKTPYIEEGTKGSGKKKGTKAYPFIAPNLEGIEEEYSAELLKEVDKIRDMA